MTTLRANSRLSRQLTLDGPMVLWRNKAGGGREGLLLTTDVCENLNCTIRHLGIQGLWVEEGLISATLRRTTITTKSLPGTSGVARPAFFVSVGLDDGAVEPQEGHSTDPAALAWLKAEFDTELRAVLLARFEGERRLIRERAPAAAGTRAAPPVLPPASALAAEGPAMSGSRAARSELTSRAPSAPAVPPGRNDPCPCGSGRKYKRCCLVRAA